VDQGRGYGHWRALFGRVVLATLFVGVAAACSRGDAEPKGVVIDVHERDFALTTAVSQVRAGFVTFRVHNTGPSTHEFIVARTDAPADALPLQKNDITVDESSKMLHEVASFGEVRLGATRQLTLNLPAGHYVLFCNFSGHYRGGMHAAVTVTG
jgi:uncharacterized cupredoxin-like copper-binding protein